jgi:NTP pyrophosphatase (non-canonical NTP hydrolase)
MEELFELIQAFRIKKGWDQSDTPYRLSKSIVVEAVELLSCFDGEAFNQDELTAELADVLLNVLSLLKDLDLDAYTILTTKLRDVDLKYPDAP